MVRLGRRVRKSSSPHNLPPTRRFRSNVSRRGFLGGSAVNLGFALAGAGSLSPFVRSAAADTRPALCYRPLQYTEGKILALPHSFDYKVIAEVGQVAGGMVHPDDPDAMGVFPGSDGGSVLVTNHENSGGDEFKVEHVDPRLTCDTGSRAIGGTTTILVGADNNAPPVRLGRGDGRQLRRRRVPMGHLADLRGNHQQEERHRPPGGPRLRLRGRPDLPGGRRQPLERGAEVPRPLRPRGRCHRPVRLDRLRHRGRRQPERPVRPLDCSAGLPGWQGCTDPPGADRGW